MHELRKHGKFSDSPGICPGSNQQQHQQRPGGDYGGDASCGGGARQRGTGIIAVVYHVTILGNWPG